MSARKSNKNDTGTQDKLDRAFYQKQITRLLNTADSLVARYEEQISKLGPVAALEALDRVLSIAERLEARRDGRAGTATAINVTVNGVSLADLKFSPPADTNGNGSASS